MKFVFCFVLLFSGTYAFGESDPAIWSRGDYYPGYPNQGCFSSKIKMAEKGAVVEKTRDAGYCGYISYVEWKDFEKNISIVTVPEGQIYTQNITVKIQAREYLNGEFKICGSPYSSPFYCLFYGCCD